MSTRPLVTTTVLALGLLTACGGGADEAQSSEDGTTTIQVAIDEGLEPDARAVIDARVAEFEEANPGIAIEPQEYTWTGDTFTAQLAGGTVPDVFTIPFTDGRGLIEAGQLADISDLVAELPYAEEFNPTVAEAGQDADGGQVAVPTEAYGQALHYNRALFEQAGLDPDSPPTTWEEVRAYAQQIADATGQAGYLTMTQGNTGGWILTTAAYAHGGRMTEGEGEDVTSTVDNPGTRAALEELRAMRWEDDSMGANFLGDWSSMNQDFAAGRIGMYITGSSTYINLATQNEIDPETYGLTTLPLTDDPDAGVLSGGTLAAVAGSATEAEQEAAVAWIDFYYLQRLADEEAVVAATEVEAEAGNPVGVPLLPVFSQELYDQRQEWISEYVNVPLDQMAPFVDGIFEQPLVAEPAVATQEVYAALDPVVQAVLTDEAADVDALLAAADAEVQSLLDRS